MPASPTRPPLSVRPQSPAWRVRTRERRTGQATAPRSCSRLRSGVDSPIAEDNKELPVPQHDSDAFDPEYGRRRVFQEFDQAIKEANRAAIAAAVGPVTKDQILR